jgi:hypothetical protein
MPPVAATTYTAIADETLVKAPCADRRPTPARDRQAGGHWFEPSTAHSGKAPLGGAFFLGRCWWQRAFRAFVERIWKALGLARPLARVSLTPDA